MLIQGRLLIDPHSPPPPGWLRVEGDRIVEIHEGEPRVEPDVGNAQALICPGFIDAHTHLPQIDSIGCDAPDLLTWLDRVIYPTERAWVDPHIAQGQCGRSLVHMARSGTLGFAGFLSSHPTGFAALATVNASVGLRCVAGQVLMDRLGPDELLCPAVDPPSHLETQRLKWSINPRFAVSCGDAMLSRAGAMAAACADHDRRHVQTHLAEQPAELDRVAELFPDAEHYTGVYDTAALLSDRTLLAHCLHLSDAEWELIAARRSVAVHCPGANTFLRSGMFDLSKAKEHGVRLALGSDVAAGPDIAMPRVARSMIEVAKLRALSGEPTAFIPSPADAWRLITEGNADALGWTDAGRLSPGAAADLLLMQLPFEIDEYLIGRLLYNWSDALITTRIIAGRRFDSPDIAQLDRMFHAPPSA